MKNTTQPNYKEATFVREASKPHYELSLSSPFWELDSTLIVAPPYSPKYFKDIPLILESPRWKTTGKGTFSGLRQLPFRNWYQGDVLIPDRPKRNGKAKKELILTKIVEDAKGTSTMTVVHFPRLFKYPAEIIPFAGQFIEYKKKIGGED